MDERYLQILRLAEHGSEPLSCPFKFTQVPGDSKGHGSRKILDALVFQECQKVGVCRWVKDDLE